ncbi:response regulator [Azospirillum sp. B2RO_4]|uniref:response regulator n=1 Tax=Azospirillum sp. B2RO_4 TaxID=3027796 RepID=UPI003DA7DF2B
MAHIDHVLIVDDDRDIRELVSGRLKRNGRRVTIAADGRQMRSFLERDRVDLIVIDIMMPGDDGLVLCRELRAGRPLCRGDARLTGGASCLRRRW